MSKDQNLQSRQIQLAIWTNTCSNMNKYKANVHGYKIQTQKHQTPSPDSDLPRLCAKLPLGRETRLTRWFSSQFAVFHSPTVRYDGKNDSSQVKRQRSFFTELWPLSSLCCCLLSLPLGGKTRRTRWSHCPSQFERNTVHKEMKYGLLYRRNTCAKLPLGRVNETYQMVLLAESHPTSRFGIKLPSLREDC